MPEPLRLNRFLAAAGVGSRRRCDDIIRQGRVTVNDEPVAQLGTRVDPERDCVTLDGAPVRLVAEPRTLVLNKPVEVLVAAGDTRGRRTVMDLLEGFPERVFPVGRLDYRSEGLLLFTNDGDLAYRLAHPRFKVEKLYRVEALGSVSEATLHDLGRGVELEDGPTLPATVAVLSRTGDRTVLDIELREGRKRQVRRMLARFGHDVVRLRRIRVGPVEMGDLPPGAWRDLSAEELRQLRSAAGLPEALDGTGAP